MSKKSGCPRSGFSDLGFMYDRGATFRTVSAICTTTQCFSRYSFTGKERDTESGNDYFGARYYASRRVAPH
jgi:hypothetical protein